MSITGKQYCLDPPVTRFGVIFHRLVLHNLHVYHEKAMPTTWLREEIVWLLHLPLSEQVRAGADVNCKDSDGCSPLSSAEESIKHLLLRSDSTWAWKIHCNTPMLLTGADCLLINTRGIVLLLLSVNWISVRVRKQSNVLYQDPWEFLKQCYLCN